MNLPTYVPPGFAAHVAAEHAAARKTATHSINWWEGLTENQKAKMAEVALARSVPDVCLERGRSHGGHASDEQPLTLHHRVEVRPLVGLWFHGPISSYQHALVNWHYPFGQLLIIHDAGSDAPPVAIVTVHPHKGYELGRAYLPGRLEDDVRPPGIRLRSLGAHQHGEIRLHTAEDEDPLDEFWPRVGGESIYLTEESSTLLQSFCQPVEPATWHFPRTGTTPTQLAEAIWKA
jgi:hypothetical protein